MKRWIDYTPSIQTQAYVCYFTVIILGLVILVRLLIEAITG